MTRMTLMNANLLRALCEEAVAGSSAVASLEKKTIGSLRAELHTLRSDSRPFASSVSSASAGRSLRDDIQSSDIQPQLLLRHRSPHGPGFIGARVPVPHPMLQA